MLIKFLNGPKAGTTKHVPRDASMQLLIEAGMVEEVFTPGPQVEDTGIAMHGMRNVLPPVVTVITWGVKPLPNSYDGKPCVVRQYFSEFTWYATPPKDCPKEIADRFADALKKWERTNKASADARTKMDAEMTRQRNL